GNDDGESLKLKPKKRKTLAVRKDRTTNSGHVSSPTPIRTIAPTGPVVAVHSYSNGEDEETQHAPEDSPRSSHPSLRESANESVLTMLTLMVIMVHLAPLAAQEESNALPNHIALERAWFTLASGAMAQTDILERFENLQDDYTRLAETHVKCSDTVKKLVTAWRDLEHNAKLYTDMENRYKGLKEEHSELEAELVRKDYALVATKKMFADGAKERQDLVAQLSKAKIKKFDCIRKLLPTVKLYPMYAKLFEKEYPFIMKIANGYRHFVSDLLKVHPNPAPFRGVSTLTIFDALAGPPELSVQKET
nr:hypothetical protein [Tanacetum cinerariifolium]